MLGQKSPTQIPERQRRTKRVSLGLQPEAGDTPPLIHWGFNPYSVWITRTKVPRNIVCDPIPGLKAGGDRNPMLGQKSPTQIPDRQRRTKTSQPRASARGCRYAPTYSLGFQPPFRRPTCPESLSGYTVFDLQETGAPSIDGSVAAGRTIPFPVSHPRNVEGERFRFARRRNLEERLQRVRALSDIREPESRSLKRRLAHKDR